VGAGAPDLKAFTVSPRRMSVSGRSTRQHARGVTFHYSLDRAAALVIVVERQRPLGTLASHCRSLGRRAASATRCRRHYVAVITLTVKGVTAGRHSLRWLARAAGRLLVDGTYRAVADAFGSGGWSRARSARFAVVRGRR
jgi:hypothetical protein